ncbi:helix-turn-helix domain-containing protein [Massilioclostridium coli]|uniref:helix-turn-helix domain-containing protein n=1 Tax=Massilioclostridium coli TaxID=1870991 RepID=UPI0022E0E11B|nr:helix-turn-helix transcriptional regulator [Massilioclostridium coli]
MEDINEIIGQRIRAYRNQQKLSQEKLAELAGLHPTYIGQVERGEKNATIESIVKISSALKVSLSQLFNLIGTDNEEQDKNNYAVRCYELIVAKSIPEQETLYHILCDLEKYQNMQK